LTIALQSLIQTFGGQEPGVKFIAYIMSELPTKLQQKLKNNHYAPIHTGKSIAALGPLILGAVIIF
jgi:hypothetical protein